jgi:hypothetical protein
VLRPLLVVYTIGVVALATLGFTSGSTAAILLAALLTLPSSVVAVPAYYMLFGLLAQVPGANPSHSSGSGICTSNGDCHLSTTGDAATWFTHATDLAGILALTAAAIVNVFLLDRVIAARRNQGQAPAQPDTR